MVSVAECNQRMRRYLARGLVWPEREFEDRLASLADVRFFPGACKRSM
jgi:hypothetical protein